MSAPHRRTFTSDFRQFFLRGLVVILPSVLTLWIVVKAYQFVDNTIAEPINRGIRVALLHTARVWEPVRTKFDPEDTAVDAAWDVLPASGRAGGEQRVKAQIRGRMRAERIGEWWASHWYMDLIGLVVAIVVVYVAGRLLGGFFGRRIYRKIERFITTLPIFKQVYPHVKQIVDFLFSDDKRMQFNRVVVIQYPRQGIWSVGFLTGGTMRSIAEHSGDSVTVFIPSSPTPFTGYTITVARDEVIELPISVEEAIRFAVSGGVLVPAHQSVGPVVVEPMQRPPARGLAGPRGEDPKPGGSGPAEDDDDAEADRQRRDAG